MSLCGLWACYTRNGRGRRSKFQQRRLPTPHRFIAALRTVAAVVNQTQASAGNVSQADMTFILANGPSVVAPGMTNAVDLYVTYQRNLRAQSSNVVAAMMAVEFGVFGPIACYIIWRATSGIIRTRLRRCQAVVALPPPLIRTLATKELRVIGADEEAETTDEEAEQINAV